MAFQDGTEFSRVIGHAESLAGEATRCWGIDLVPYEESLSLAYAYAKSYYAETCHIFVPADADFHYKGVFLIHINKEHCQINIYFSRDTYKENIRIII